MDMTESIAPKSDQLNADDLLTGPRTFTIDSVTKGSREQPFNFHLVEVPGRPYRPSKTMRRLMVSGWGKDPREYIGRQLTLYRNPEITFGKEKVGGIEISHMTHLDKTLRVSLTAARGRRRMFTIEPLTVAAVNAEPTISREQWDEIASAAANAGIENPAQFAAQVLGRQLAGPHEITLHDRAVLLEQIGGATNG
ncbi:hypothetical protein [Glutamicibacter creatinolyticus]|uniref:hypothetical protein n=1 Tax=Glutamicibacter creatinolyticus TaxID=162496 RepID=UPI0032179277